MVYWLARYFYGLYKNIIQIKPEKYTLHSELMEKVCKQITKKEFPHHLKWHQIFIYEYTGREEIY